MTLNELKIGVAGRYHRRRRRRSRVRRPLDMGIIPKTRVTLQKVAPMGDPIETACAAELTPRAWKKRRR